MHFAITNKTRIIRIPLYGDSMKRICAWCKVALGSFHLKEDSLIDIPEETHGICQNCSASFISNGRGQDFLDYIDSLPTNILVVDENARAIHANTMNLLALGKDLSEVRDKLGGVIFNCEYSHLPGGCGNTLHCPQCVIRNAVIGTMSDSQPRSDIRADLYQRQPDGNNVWFSVIFSTEKAGSVVLMRINAISPKEP